MAFQKGHMDCVVATGLDPKHKVDMLSTWFFRKFGRLHHDVNIVWTASYGYHLRVHHAQGVPANCLIVACPHHLSISVMDLEWAKDPWPEALKSHWMNQPEVLTRFFIMEQYLEKQESFWWPYIASLPQPDQPDQMNTPMWYDDSDLIWIKGTNLDGGRISRSTTWRKEYEESILLLRSYCSNRRPRLHAYTWILYKWAATILTSRCFGGSLIASRIIPDGDPAALFKRKIIEKWTAEEAPSFPVLLPVYDLANHDPFAKITWDWDTSNSFFITNQAFGPGQQVFNNYGPKSNEELIMGYGFSIPYNEADAFTLALSMPSCIEKMENISPAELENSAVFENPLDTPSRDDTQGLSPETYYIRYDPEASLGVSSHNSDILVALTSKLANSRELQNFRTALASVRDASSSSHIKTTVACQFLTELRHQLSKITRHDEELPIVPQSMRQIHAAIYRRSQKRIIHDVITFLENLLERTIYHEHRAVNLKVVLEQSLLSFRSQFRAAIHHSLRTRNPEKLREGGYQDLVFTIWVCTLWMCCHVDEEVRFSPDTKASFMNHLKPWFRFLRQTYGPGDGTANHSDAECRDIVSSYLPIITSYAAQSPESIYANPGWTVDFLQWGFKIVQEEGFHCPALAGSRGEQTGYMLFLEGRDDES